MSSAPYGDPRTRRRILEAAWELVEQHGAGFRLADVAQRAGVSRQALYLHFADRGALLLAVVDFIDESAGVDEMAAEVFAAGSGAEMLERAVALHAALAPRIDRVAQALEVTEAADPAARSAWRDRLSRRRSAHLRIARRIADDGELAPEWTAEAAADLIHATTLPAVWRELTRELGWTDEAYEERVGRLLRRALLVGG